MTEQEIKAAYIAGNLSRELYLRRLSLLHALRAAHLRTPRCVCGACQTQNPR